MPIEITTAGVQYAAGTKLIELAVETAETQNLRTVAAQITQGAKIHRWLQALDYSDYLSQAQIDQIVRCLLEIAEVNDIPVAPVLGNVTPPSILVGIPGQRGEQGEEGAEGGGVPFSYPDITQDTVVDSFAITESRGVEYTLNIYSGDDHMRTMRIQGAWTSDGSTYGDDGGIGQTIVGDVSDVSMSIIVSGSTVQLLATVVPGETWTIEGTRKYIPNNGNGITTPTTLADGRIFVGNASNSPTAVAVSGDITISNTGVVEINSGVIKNTDISASAAISVSKLEALTASKAVVTDSSGILKTSTTTADQIGFLSNVSSDVQAQLDSKLGTASGAISTVTGTNLTPNYAVISNPAGKIAVSSVNTTELGYVQGVTSGIQSQLNGKVNDTGDVITGTLEIQGGIRLKSSGSYFKKEIVDIGSWNMDSTGNVTINHNISDITKITGATAFIRNDAGTQVYPIALFYNNATAGLDIYCAVVNATNMTIVRAGGSIFDSTSFDDAGISRGTIAIEYIA